MNNKIYFNVDDTAVTKETPVPECGENMYKSEIVIDKETFIKCYEMWIKGEKEVIE